MREITSQRGAPTCISPEELSAIAVGYTKPLEESASVLTDLKIWW